MRNSLILLSCLLLMLVWSREAHAGKSYDNCTGFITSVPAVISTPGTWCLKQDVTTPITSGDAISVATDGVTIDCNDFRLDGVAGSATDAVGIHSLDHSRLTVRHCTIRGFFRGIYAEGTGTQAVIEDNHVDGNYFVGITVDPNQSVIRRNLVTNTGSSTSATAPTYFYGITVHGTNGVDVLDNTVSGVNVPASVDYASTRGIALSYDAGGSILRNNIRGLHSNPATGVVSGIQVYEGTRAVIAHNNVEGGGQNGRGIWCYGASLSTTFPQVRLKQNIVAGFSPSYTIYHCGDAGANDTSP